MAALGRRQDRGTQVGTRGCSWYGTARGQRRGVPQPGAGCYVCQEGASVLEAGGAAHGADEDLARSITDLNHERFEQHLAEAECLIVPGGLRFRDTISAAEAAPGCCFGLENWRDWQNVFHEQEPWLGHDPAPQIEHEGQLIRLTPSIQSAPTTSAIEIHANELPDLLALAQRQLHGFLELVHRWTAINAPRLATPLTVALDIHLKITQPLGASSKDQ